jgi:hypothetical protein
MAANRKHQISDQAILDATGRTREAWFDFIDQRDGKNLSHKEIATLLGEETDISPWWGQFVTVEYELARGKRKLHEMLDGFQISKSRTFPVSADVLYQALVDADLRKLWMEDSSFAIRNSTENKTIRITWVDGTTHVDVYLYPKKGRTQLTINHKKLKNSAQAEKMKLYWGNQFDRLSAYLED